MSWFHVWGACWRFFWGFTTVADVVLRWWKTVEAEELSNETESTEEELPNHVPSCVIRLLLEKISWKLLSKNLPSDINRKTKKMEAMMKRSWSSMLVILIALCFYLMWSLKGEVANPAKVDNIPNHRLKCRVDIVDCTRVAPQKHKCECESAKMCTTSRLQRHTVAFIKSSLDWNGSSKVQWWEHDFLLGERW